MRLAMTGNFLGVFSKYPARAMQRYLDCFRVLGTVSPCTACQAYFTATGEGGMSEPSDSIMVQRIAASQAVRVISRSV